MKTAAAAASASSPEAPRMTTVSRHYFGGASSESDHDLRVAIIENIQEDYGMFVWPCSVILAEYVWQQRPRFSGSRVVELGAGTSLPGVVAAKIGADVTLTDIAHNTEVLNNIRQICDLNNVSCSVLGLTWGDWDEPIFDLHPHIILGADVFYDSSNFDDLFSTVTFLLENSPGAVFITTYHNRSGHHLIEFLMVKWGLKCLKLLDGFSFLPSRKASSLEGNIQLVEIALDKEKPNDLSNLDWDDKVRIVCEVAQGLQHIFDDESCPIFPKQVNDEQIFLRNGETAVLFDLSETHCGLDNAENSMSICLQSFGRLPKGLFDLQGASSDGYEAAQIAYVADLCQRDGTSLKDMQFIVDVLSTAMIVNRTRSESRASVTKIPIRIEDIEKVPAISEEIKSRLRSNPKVILETTAPYCYLSRLENSYGELTIGCNLKSMEKGEWVSTQQDILLEAARIIKSHAIELGSTMQCC